MRRAAALLLFMFLTPLAHALNTWGTDYSDLWFNPAESGWGINIAHQREIIFATFFVYGADSKTRWYVASAMAHDGSANQVFTGTLFETTGPFLGGPFNPGAVANRPAGTATLTFSSPNQATLAYTVDNVPVSKTIERQTFRWAEMSGVYLGSAQGTVTGCSGNYLTTGEFTVTQAVFPGTSFSMNAILDNARQCTYTGTYEQHGRMGSATGTFSCTGSVVASGTFDAFEIEAGSTAVAMRYEARYGACVERGKFSMLKP